MQYLDNKIDSFVYTNPFGGNNLPPVTGCKVTGPASAMAAQVYTVDCSGQAGYNSPPWSFNLGADQTIPLGEYKLVVTGDVRYRGNRVIGFERLAQQNSGSDTTVDLSVTFGAQNGMWSITGYVRNLTDAISANAAQFSGTAGNTISTNYAPRRTFGARVSFKF